MGVSFDPTNIFSAGVALYNGIQQNKWASRNYRLQQESLDETRFMNRNQFQIQASDAQKAGINPLAMSGGSVSSASAQNVDAPQDGGMLSVLGNIISMKHEEKMQDKQIDSQVSENEKNRQHDENMKRMQIQSEEKRHSERLREDSRQFDSNLEEIKSYHQQINNIEQSKLDKHQQEIELDKIRVNIERSSTDALNVLRRQQYSLNKAQILSNLRELARDTLSGFMKSSGGKIGAFINWSRDLGIHLSSSLKGEDLITSFVNEYFKLMESESNTIGRVNE